MASYATVPFIFRNSTGHKSIQNLKVKPVAPFRSLSSDPGALDAVINASNIRVGGDGAGFIFSAGIVIVFLVGVPALRWFPLGAAVVGVVVSIGLRFFHSHSSDWVRYPGFLGIVQDAPRK